MNVLLNSSLLHITHGVRMVPKRWIRAVARTVTVQSISFAPIENAVELVSVVLVLCSLQQHDVTKYYNRKYIRLDHI